MHEMPCVAADLSSLDRETLRALVLAQQEKLLSRDSEIEHLKLIIAKLRRMMFGTKSEKITREIKQLELKLEELEVRKAERAEARPGSEPPSKRPGLLAHVLVAKYADHLRLYRQSEIYAREGVDLDRSTLADWVGAASHLLSPLVDQLRRHVLAAPKLHADDTPVPVLAPGTGKTKTARLWTYVRDDRAAADDAPPAVWFAYSEDRKGEHPKQHLSSFSGILEADGYAGFHHLYEGGRIVEAACWAHVRRKFYDIQVANGSSTAAEAVKRIGALYDIEREVRGKPAEVRTEIRQARARPLLDELHRWLNKTLAGLSRKSDTALAIRYALSRWRALSRYIDDGRIEMDNSAAERALRTVALGRKNYLFAGSDVVESVLRPSTACSVRRSSTDWTQNSTCAMSSNASPTIRSTNFSNYCPGTSSPSFRLISLSLKCPSSKIRGHLRLHLMDGSGQNEIRARH
jgi:hypothetical protein